jgi:hypothetical protein
VLNTDSALELETLFMDLLEVLQGPLQDVEACSPIHEFIDDLARYFRLFNLT